MEYIGKSVVEVMFIGYKLERGVIEVRKWV